MAGGIYTCLNGGSCINNNGVGVCQCPTGYTGTYCATALGCNAGGSFACQNGGACNSGTGICSCQNGYTGNYCATCKNKQYCVVDFSISSFDFICTNIIS